MFEAERYPIDYETIKKGDVIARDRLVELLGGDPESAKFHARRAELADQIQRHLWAIDKPFTVCIVKGEIAILSDTDASEYNARWFRKHQYSLNQNHRQMLAVDTAQLTDEQRRSHERAAAIQGITLAAMAAARRAIPAPAQRQDLARLPDAG